MVRLLGLYLILPANDCVCGRTKLYINVSVDHPWLRHIQMYASLREHELFLADSCHFSFENKGSMMGCSNPHPHGQVSLVQLPPQEVNSDPAAVAGLVALLHPVDPSHHAAKLQGLRQSKKVDSTCTSTVRLSLFTSKTLPLTAPQHQWPPFPPPLIRNL